MLLLCIIAPFFVTYLIRTLAWQTILADNGFVVALAARPRTSSARTAGCSRPGRR